MLPAGKELEQAVVFEWTPLFCKKCNKVGHDCDKKVATKKKVTKQWVPKVPHQQKEPAQLGVVEPSVDVPVTTPMPAVHAVNSDSDGGWKVVTKKTKDKGYSAYCACG